VTVLLLVRHGVTEANEIGTWQGWDDTALTPLGHEQALAVARRIASEFSPQAVHTSSLLRARQTAEPIAQAARCPLIPNPGLREINFGDVSGLTIEQFRAKFAGIFEAWTDKRNVDFVWPGGESRRAFFTRVWRAMDEIVKAHPLGEAVIVGHGGSLRAALAYLLPREFTDWWTYELRNASLSVVEITKAGPALKALNDCAHLERAEPPMNIDEQ